MKNSNICVLYLRDNIQGCTIIQMFFSISITLQNLFFKLISQNTVFIMIILKLCNNYSNNHMEQNQDINERLNIIYAKVSLECKGYLENDPLVQREDTCKGLIALLEQIKTVLKEVNSLKVEQRAKNYHVTYNAVNYILDISEHLRKTNFAFEASLILAEAIKSMQGNIVLQDVKFLDKITELYLKLAKIYEDGDNYQESVALLQNGLKQYKDLKAIHELDQPVPQYVQTILSNNTKLLKAFLIKYNIQAGGISPAQWRKKVDEQFADDIEIKLFCLIETLRTETRKHSNIFTKNLKSFKQSLLTNGYQMVKPHMQVLLKGLTQQKEKIQRQVNFRSTLNATQQQINEQIKKRRQLQQKFIKQSDIKKASDAFPLEYHAQMIHYALQIKNSKILSQLIECAMMRIECRRIEVPYVNDIMIIVSNSPYPNIPNGYTKIPTDLNEANMRKELIKLRKSGKKAPQDQVLKQPSNAPPPAGKDDKKDSKKGGKQPQKPQQSSKQNELNREPTEWQLNEIKHKYVYMMVKKSMSPQGALYGMSVVLGDQQKGPVGFTDNRRIIVPYVQQNMKVIQSQISQHTGVRENTGLVPYVILYHSRNNLDDQNQRKTIITDVAPLIGKNPIVPSKWGYKKIDVDLRQVPSEFIKAPNHDYVYLTYKTDDLFHISERHVQIIKAFIELQASYGQRKSTSNEEEKYLQLQINYSLEKLNLFFETFQECLRGQLGQQYYLQKCDFLTHLTLQIWTKYLKNSLIQFDYMKQQRLNGEIIDQDYTHYKKILEDCNPIYLKGLKILNFIMINNPKSDILLQSKINIELAKLLQQAKFYKMAAQNLKLCLDKLRKIRDEYLAKGVEGISDRILPFSATCSNTKIKQCIIQMRKRFFQQRRHLEKVIRIRERQKQGQKALNAQQIQQQEKQFIRFRKNDQFDEIVDKIQTKHTQLYAILYALELDLLNLYFRVSLKRADEVSRFENSKNDQTNGIKNSDLEGLATTMKQKLGLLTGPTQTKNVQNLNELQGTLVKANKLPAPKPKLQKAHLKLIIQYQKNPYGLALLMLNFAALNSQNNDKKYYLQESLNNILSCIELQKQLMDQSINNAIFIFSGLWDNKIKQGQNSEKIHPFKDLYTNVWQVQTQIPDAPILISKNSTSIHLKLPPYVPLRTNEKRDPKVVKYMSVYGKPSANGVDVSLNCVQLEGTGIRKEVGKSVKVSSLSANNLYCFAAAGIDQNDEIMRIGKTSQNIGTFNSFSIPMIASYLAKVSYQISEYDIAEKAARIVVKQYCNEAKYYTPDERVNNLYYYTLNEAAVSGVSLFQMKSISQSFYVLALCQRRKLIEMKETSKDKALISFQQKQKIITNFLMLSAALTPSLTSPNMSIPFLIPQNQTLLRAITISMIPQKWMNPRIRKIGVGVMEKLLKWGLENNEINLARRLVYKWNQRKFLMMGKMIQIQEKKQVKKGPKDAKQQQVKLIDKYCRLMIEKSPQLMDAFQDSVITISQEYYDYVAMFVQKAKDQINTLSQYVDNAPEEIDSINNHLALKIELIQYMKEPLQSIKKIANTSPYYFEYNCKILKKALQTASQSQIKQVLVKAEELDVPDASEDLKISKEIYELMFSAIREDISWSPQSKKELIEFQQKTGKDLKKAIDIFSNWQTKKIDLTEKVRKSLALTNKHKDFDYLNMWISELYHLKAQSYLLVNSNQFNVKRKIKMRYDKVQTMNIDDLFKKEKEVSVLEDKPYAYSEDQLKKLTQILSYLSQAIYSAMVIQNWLKLQSLLKFICNIICYIQITPFYHRGSNIWTYFAFISLCSIQMLKRIRAYGFNQFKNRYNSKLVNTQKKSIMQKLQLGEFSSQQLIQKFTPEYFLPDLDPNTTKSYWFNNIKDIDIEAISSIIAYTVNTLRLENKHNLVINVVREFCNITQHYFSLSLLPFMTNSQSKLIDEVSAMIDKEAQELSEVKNVYNIEKQKKGKKRAAGLTGEKFDFQIAYQQKSSKLNESLRLLNEQKKFLELQTNKSNRIKDEISRDTSKQVMAQKDLKKYMQQFGQHYQQMLREFGQQAKHVKKSKNFIKDIINKYDQIYVQLQNSKTSKDPYAQIQNRNDYGNLWFAYGGLDKAYQFWNDSLATIFKKVNPIQNYHQILQENRPYLVRIIGIREIMIAFCLLYKVSNFGAFNKLNIQRACTHFACHLAFSLFQSNIDNPQTYQMFKEFRIKKFPAREIFADENSINLSELLASLQYFILRNIYEENGLSALPMATLFDYIATDVVKNAQLSIKAKILKSICLTQAGYISQSIKLLARVAFQKDLPIIWLQSSDYLKKEKGMNWVYQGPIFNNSQFWSTADNKSAIQQFKKLIIRPQSTNLFGIINPILFNYARSFILFKIYENQICKDDTVNDQRLQSLAQVESLLRETLKKLAIIEESYSLLEQYEINLGLYRQNEVSDDLKKQMESSKAKMIEFLKKNGSDDATVKLYQKEQFSATKRITRLELICRIRYTLHKISESKNLFTNSYFILKNGLTNMHRYAIGARICETGYDPQVKTVNIAAPPAGGKKDDKKGGKKQQQAPQQIVAPPIDQKKEQQLKAKNEAKQSRTALNAFWHIKLLFQIAKITFKQNNFKQSIKLFQGIADYSKKCQQLYFYLNCKTFICRAKLRLGSYDPQEFKNIISRLEDNKYFDINFLNFIMDFGELLSGDPKSLEYFQKGTKLAQTVWERYGMKSILNGIGQVSGTRNYYLKEEPTADQDEAIKKKKKGEKKGGKDDKKAPPKKEDPKKKKQQNKLDYKVVPLSKVVDVNLLEEQKNIFGEYTVSPHPNYRKNNIYQSYAIIYIKSYLRYLTQRIKLNPPSEEKSEDLSSQVAYILKLLHVIDSYSHSTQHLKILLNYCAAKINKNIFIKKIHQLIKGISKAYSNIMKYPYQDFPLNSTLVKIPAYSEFIAENRKYLIDAKTYFKKCLAFVENSALFYQRMVSIEDFAWEYADNQCLLAQFIGRQKPKFFPEDQIQVNLDQKRLQTLNSILEASSFIEFSIKIRSIKFQISRNYLEIGGKGMQANAKIDEDITSQILQMDKQYKKSYSQFLIDNYKGKPAVTGTDILTYMLKIHRQAQYMTFTNSFYQNLLFKCNRILTKSLTGYKDKCLIGSMDVPLKKSIKDKFVENQMIMIKSIRNKQSEMFLYVLGPSMEGEQIVYGRIIIQSNNISKITEDLLSLSTKMMLSDKKSENVKNRDYSLYKIEFKRILHEMSLNFGNPKLDENIKPIPEENLVELNAENIKVTHKILDINGLVVKNKDVNKYLRYLHKIKYHL